MTHAGREVVADRSVGDCEQPPRIIGNAAAPVCGSIITNKAMPDIEGPGVFDATTKAGPVVRHGTMDDGQCGLVIEDAAPKTQRRNP